MRSRGNSARRFRFLKHTLAKNVPRSIIRVTATGIRTISRVIWSRRALPERHSWRLWPYGDLSRALSKIKNEQRSIAIYYLLGNKQQHDLHWFTYLDLYLQSAGQRHPRFFDLIMSLYSRPEFNRHTNIMGSRRAVSALIAIWPGTIILILIVGTPMFLDSQYRLIPIH